MSEKNPTQRVKIGMARRPATAAGDSSQNGPRTVRRGKNWTAKRGAGSTEKLAPFPVTVCSVRLKDPTTGQWAKMPKEPKAKKGRAVARRGRGAAGVIGVRTVVDGETVAARAILPDARRSQRRGKAKVADVRGAERDVAREILTHHNPRLAESAHLEQMHEAHRSDKARRGAATRKANLAAGRTKKKRDPVVIQTQLLKVEQRLKDAQRRHAGARSITTKSKHAETIGRARARRDQLRAELRRAGG